VRRRDLTETQRLCAFFNVAEFESTFCTYGFMSILNLALLQDDPGIALHLIAAGVDVNQTTRIYTGDFESATDLTLLHVAISRANRKEVILAMLEAGAGPNARTTYFHASTPLHLAIKKQQTTTVRYLLQHGASTSELDVYDATPRQFALEVQASPVIVRLLNTSESLPLIRSLLTPALGSEPMACVEFYLNLGSTRWLEMRRFDFLDLK
jgi:ankyrin repeat protein